MAELCVRAFDCLGELSLLSLSLFVLAGFVVALALDRKNRKEP